METLTTTTELQKPDKKKLIEFAASLVLLSTPDNIKSAEAQKIINEASDRLKGVAAYIKQQADTL